MRFFTSDWHMFHKNIRRICNRPFSSDEEMRETIINNFNSVVTNEDDVYILGDFLWKDAAINEIMPRLNGKTFTLVAGNHDGAHSLHKKFSKIKECMLKGGFNLVVEDMIIVIGERLTRLNHFPYIDFIDDPSITPEYELRYKDQRPRKGPERLLIHGHRHSKSDAVVRLGPHFSIDCGVDGNDFMPWSEEDILKVINGVSLYE